ncbi:hypothetical protein LINPERHAP1_LOCUS8372 [Linum perenne]
MLHTQTLKMKGGGGDE